MDRELSDAVSLSTVVTEVGGGRFLRLPLWETAEDMHEAREALDPLVDRLLNPLMTAPSKLLGTGRVVVNDLVSSLGNPERKTDHVFPRDHIHLSRHFPSCIGDSS
ncbi:MAG: hypothetical protein A4E19_19320 [Nitrospira sp. SG-bin1]|nr:MAG: hypothetical protein A4E19_19320 [Nitrospira sp. SG-bin1]